MRQAHRCSGIRRWTQCCGEKPSTPNTHPTKLFNPTCSGIKDKATRQSRNNDSSFADPAFQNRFAQKREHHDSLATSLAKTVRKDDLRLVVDSPATFEHPRTRLGGHPPVGVSPRSSFSVAIDRILSRWKILPRPPREILQMYRHLLTESKAIPIDSRHSS